MQQVLQFEIGAAVQFVNAVELRDELDGVWVFDEPVVGDRLGVGGAGDAFADDAVGSGRDTERGSERNKY